MVPNNESEVSPGQIDSHKSICEIIDCCVLFFYNVAYKYVVMVRHFQDYPEMNSSVESIFCSRLLISVTTFLIYQTF